MTTIFAEKLLTPEGWLNHQLITINDLGIIQSISELQQQQYQYRSKIIIPGFINLHSHAFQWSMAGLAENFGRVGDSFWSWRELMYQFVQKIDADDLGVIAEALYIDMLKAGYTEVGEFHYLHNSISGEAYSQRELLSIVVVEAARNAGIAICHMPVLYQYAGFERQPLTKLQQRFALDIDNYISINQELKKFYLKDPLVKIGIAPHSLRAVDIQQLKQLVEYDAASSPIHIHVAEQLAEVEQSLSFSNKRPIHYLYDNIQITPNWCLVHATHLTPVEISRIAESGAIVGLCPTTEANLGDGIFPLTEYTGATGLWGIGSDSHVTVDPRAELRLLEYGQRLIQNRRAVYSDQQRPLTATNLIQDSVKGGKCALQSSAGEIKAGARANLLSLQIPSHLEHFSAEQFISNWIFSSRDNWIKDVMVSGKWVVQQGQHPKQKQIDQNLLRVLKKLQS